MILQTEEDRIYDLDIFQLWNRIKLESECPKSIKEGVRWGFLNPPIEIHMLGNMQPKGKKGKYLHMGKAFNSDQVWEDIDKREILGKKWMLENVHSNPIARARSYNE